MSGTVFSQAQNPGISLSISNGRKAGNEHMDLFADWGTQVFNTQIIIDQC